MLTQQQLTELEKALIETIDRSYPRTDGMASLANTISLAAAKVFVQGIHEYEKLTEIKEN